MHIILAYMYAPQMGCQEYEKEDFRQELESIVRYSEIG